MKSDITQVKIAQLIDKIHCGLYNLVQVCRQVKSSLLTSSNCIKSVKTTRPKIRSCWKQDTTMLLGQHCSMLSTILFGIATPDRGLIQAQQYCLISLTTRNNVVPTTLLHPVFNSFWFLQLIIFCRVNLIQLDTCRRACFLTILLHLVCIRIAGTLL